MRTIKLCAAGVLALAACTSTPDTTPAPSPLSSTGRFAFDQAAVALLPAARATAYADMAAASARPPDLVLEIASGAVVGIGLDVAPLGATPIESAWAFVQRWQ